MNKDKLIEFAKEQCEIFPEDSGMGMYLRETLKILQEEPCEDAISKASVFEILGNLMSIPYDFDRQITEKDASESMDEIGALPPVISAHKKVKGKWERGYSFPDGEYVKCTICGEIIKCIYPMHYCPNCGAEMESR